MRTLPPIPASPGPAACRLPALLAGAAILALGLAGCETGPAPASPSSSGAAGAASPSLAEGRRLYYGRCTACHAPEPIADYTQSEWREMVAHMRKRAKLTPTEEASLIAFLMAHAPPG